MITAIHPPTTWSIPCEISPYPSERFPAGMLSRLRDWSVSIFSHVHNYRVQRRRCFVFKQYRILYALMFGLNTLDCIVIDSYFSICQFKAASFSFFFCLLLDFFPIPCSERFIRRSLITVSCCRVEPPSIGVSVILVSKGPFL